MNKNPISDNVLQSVLTDICNSKTFGRAERLKHLLKHIVIETAAGNNEALLGKNIYADIFKNGHGGLENLAAVRVEIGRLRQRLALYYAREGRDDEIVIRIPRGGYVAAFEKRPRGSAEIQSARQWGFGLRRRRLAWALVASAIIMLASLVVSMRSATEAPASDVPRLAVVTIENLTGDPDQDTLTHGLTVDLVNRLARFSHMVVVSRRATAQIQVSDDAPDTRRARLGADYQLNGAVQSSDAGARLSLELIALPSGDVAWVDEIALDAGDGDFPMLQVELANRIARTLAGKSGAISGLELRSDEKLADRPAYACVLRYYAYLSQRSEAGHRAVRACLEQASRTTPGYAEIWTALANIYLDEKRNSYNLGAVSEDPLNRAYAAAQRSVDLAPQSASAHSVLAAIEFFRGDMPSFRAAARRGMQLNPNDVDTLAYFGHLLTVSGNWEEGQQILDRAKTLSPVHPPLWHHSTSMVAMLEKNYARSLAEAEAGMLPKFYLSHLLTAAANGYLGNKKEAAQAYMRLSELRPDYLSQIHDDLNSRNFAPELIDTLSNGLEVAASFDK